jgi:hypothetical protein
MMNTEQALEFDDRLRVIVHAQIEIIIVVTAVAAAGPHDDHAGGLLAPAVPADGIARQQGRHQSIRQFAASIAEGHGHGVQRLWAGENVALAGEILAGAMPGPGITAAARVRC